MTEKPFHAQREAYNRAALRTATALDILGNVVVKGWEPHVQLRRVYQELQQACDALIDIEPNLLGIETRELMKRLQGEHHGV